MPENSGLVCEHKKITQMRCRPSALHAAHHTEVRLKSIQKSKKHKTRLIVLGRRSKYVSGERDRRSKKALIKREIAFIKRSQRKRSNWSDRVEDSQQSIAVSLLIALNQPVIVEVITRIHAHAGWQPPTHGNFKVSV